jgi:hypothetical protein
VRALAALSIGLLALAGPISGERNHTPGASEWETAEYAGTISFVGKLTAQSKMQVTTLDVVGFIESQGALSIAVRADRSGHIVYNPRLVVTESYHTTISAPHAPCRGFVFTGTGKSAPPPQKGEPLIDDPLAPLVIDGPEPLAPLTEPQHASRSADVPTLGNEFMVPVDPALANPSVKVRTNGTCDPADPAVMSKAHQENIRNLARTLKPLTLTVTVRTLASVSGSCSMPAWEGDFVQGRMTGKKETTQCTWRVFKIRSQSRGRR